MYCAAEPLVWYNLACSYALLNQPDDAFASLSRAIELGFTDFVGMGMDEDSVLPSEATAVLFLAQKGNPEIVSRAACSPRPQAGRKKLLLI